MTNSFIESVITTPVALTANDSPIQFQFDRRTRSTQGCDGWLCHKEGSPLYKLVKAGCYDISFSATLFSATAGVIAVGLYEDGILIPSSVRAVTVGAGEFTSVSFDDVENVCCKSQSTITVASVPNVISPATLAPVDTEIPTVYAANLNITK